jgi:hypothetical protein
MRYETPQFIEIEAKIVGFLTLKQFGYIAVAFLINLVLYLLFKPFVVFTIGLPIAGIAIALGFVKINGMSLGKYFLKAMAFAFRPKTYVWHKRQNKQ